MGKRFERLRRKIEVEYEKKGYAEKRANSIAYATAAKIARERKECIACKMHVPHKH